MEYKSTQIVKPYRQRIEAIIRNKYEKTFLIATQNTRFGSHPSFVGGGIEEDEHWIITLQREILEEVGVVINTASIRELPDKFKYDYSELYQFREAPKKQNDRMVEYEGTETRMILVDFLYHDKTSLKKDAMSFDFYSYEDTIEIFENSINIYPDKGIIPVLENRLKSVVNNESYLIW